MAKNVTLLQLRTDARLYADRRETGVGALFTDTEATRLVNTSIADLYDLLVGARGHEYYITSDTISIVSGTATYNLPADFYELFSLTLEWASDDNELVAQYHPVGERGTLNNYATWGEWSPKGFRLRGSQIEILPTPTSAVTGRLQYVPVYTTLSADGDTFDGVNGWEKLVTLDVAMQMRAAEELPFNDLERLYDRQRARIEELAAQRAAETPQQVVNVFPEGSRNVWPYYHAGRITTP